MTRSEPPLPTGHRYSGGARGQVSSNLGASTHSVANSEKAPASDDPSAERLSKQFSLPVPR
jgi:hypothetical protein